MNDRERERGMRDNRVERKGEDVQDDVLFCVPI
jgi:hypothetical protein